MSYKIETKYDDKGKIRILALHNYMTNNSITIIRYNAYVLVNGKGKESFYYDHNRVIGEYLSKGYRLDIRF